MANNWFAAVIVEKGFPLSPGEVLRIHYPGSRRETRIKLGFPTAGIGGNTVTFPARSHAHDVGTNKESISLVGNERKLRRV